MTNYVHVAEFANLGAGHQSTDIDLLDASSITSSYNVQSSAASAQSPAFQSAVPAMAGPTGQQPGTASPSTKWVYLCADTASNVVFGTNPTATTATGVYLPSGIPVIFRVPANQSWKLAVITAA